MDSTATLAPASEAASAPVPAPATIRATPAPSAAAPGSLAREVRESALLLGLSVAVTAGLTVGLQAALSTFG